MCPFLVSVHSTDYTFVRWRPVLYSLSFEKHRKNNSYYAVPCQLQLCYQSPQFAVMLTYVSYVATNTSHVMLEAQPAN